jgi:hypothetical protein
MNYKRLSSLLVATLVVLLLISFGLICTWVYFYFGNHTEAAKEAPLDKNRRDSLQRAYAATMNDLHTPLDSIWNNPDTVAMLDTKIIEFNRLRQEISGLLQRSTTNRDLDSARQKISILQQKIEDLRNRTMVVEYENRRLNEIVNQLSRKLARSAESARKEAGAHAAGERISISPDPSASGYEVNDIRLSAIDVDGPADEETADPSKADKISGSFLVKNNGGSASPAEMMVVITGPDGKVLKGSSWESGSFDTNEGRKIYSCRLAFQNSKGDNRRVYFSIATDELKPGNYSVQVYQNGRLAGRSTRTF